MDIALASQRAQSAVNLSVLPLEITNSAVWSIFVLCELNFDRFQTDSKPANLINEHYLSGPRYWPGPTTYLQAPFSGMFTTYGNANLQST